MGAHYLVDLFNNVLASSQIIDVREPRVPQTVQNGSFIVRIPDGVAVEEPTNLGDLITQKYNGLLASFPGFTRISRDDLLDATGLQLTASTSCLVGERASVSLLPGGHLSSVAVPLPGNPPDLAAVTWEIYSFTDADVAGSTFQRTYTEVAPSATTVTCQVSFNGGGSYLPVLDGAIFSIAPADQGASFVIQFTNNAPGRLYLGSWAVIY